MLSAASAWWRSCHSSACARTPRGGGRHDGSARAPTGTGTRGSDAIVVESDGTGSAGVDLESSSARLRASSDGGFGHATSASSTLPKAWRWYGEAKSLAGLRGERGECMAPARRKNLVIEFPAPSLLDAEK